MKKLFIYYLVARKLDSQQGILGNQLQIRVKIDRIRHSREPGPDQP